MKILVRHLFVNLLQPLFYLLLTFSLLFVVADLMDNADHFFTSKTSLIRMLCYYGLKLPSNVIFIVPLCLLLATLYSLSVLTRHNEIVAMRTGGINIYCIIRPYMLTGFVCFLFTAAVNEYIGPKYAYRARQLLESQKRNSDEAYFKNIPFHNLAAGHTWYIEQFDTRTYKMKGIMLRRRRSDGSDREKITAKKGFWLDQRWWFEDISIQRFDEHNNLSGPAESFQTLEMSHLPETPEDFMGEAKDTEYHSSIELQKYIRTHPFLSPKTLNKYTVDLHHKLSMPFICFIAMIVGIPVGSHTGRKGALAGIMAAIGMFFGFYAVQFTMEYMAKQMFIPPWAGVWTAVIIFFLAGGFMIWRMR